MIPDFKETLEVSRNCSANFLCYSYCHTQEDLAIEDEYSTRVLDFNDNASLEEVASLIEDFCPTDDKTSICLQRLLDTGRVIIEEEY